MFKQTMNVHHHHRIFVQLKHRSNTELFKLRRRTLKTLSLTNSVQNSPNDQSKLTNNANVREDVVRNTSNIQMISDQLYTQVFIDRFRGHDGCDDKTFDKCKLHLKAHSLWNKNIVPPAAPINLKIPNLEGISIEDHFRNIALQQTFKYKALLDELMSNIPPPMPSKWVLQTGWTKYLSDDSTKQVSFPEEDAYIFDIEICLANGHVPTLACALSPKAWYTWCSLNVVHGTERSPTERISLDDLIPFETSTGETNRNWTEKVIVGHNVSYDRSRIKEQYLMQQTKLRFVDTMSMHIAVSGITSFQRALKMTMNKGLKTVASDKREELLRAGALEWNDISSLNNLADVYKLYCGGAELKKETRKVFVNGNIKEIKDDFQNLMLYCANDVAATYQILLKLMPLFYERFPHPATFSGMLEMGMTYLPVNSNWPRYIETCEEKFDSLENEMKSVLMKKADEALQLLEGDQYKNDPWLWDLDWKVTRARKKLSVANENLSEIINDGRYPAWYKKLFYKKTAPDYKPGPSKLSTSMRIVPKLLRLCWFGFPLHHSKKGGWGFLVKKPESELELETETEADISENHETFPGDENSGESIKEIDGGVEFPYKEWEKIWKMNKKRLSRHVNKTSPSNVQVLGKELQSNPEETVQNIQDFMKGLESITDLGLRSEKPKKSAKVMAIIRNSYAHANSPHVKCVFYPLPHKDGTENRVGNPLAKDFLNKIEDEILTCENGEDIANQVVRLSKMVSYWRNNRDRIIGQVTVWLKESEFPISHNSTSNEFEYGAILPQVSVSGTLTRRAVEKTWLTASNAYVDRVGSELKGMIQAPDNYHFVGADVDSQELWIASIIGDAYFAGFHGSTALGWMTLQGTKSAGTDMHSKTAALIGIDRDQAKILNYGRMFGAGITFAERLLRQFNHQMTVTEAKDKAKKMYKMTKGERKFMLNESGRSLAESLPPFQDKQLKPFSRKELNAMLRLAEYPNMNMMDFVDKIVWDEGTESPMFNRIEEIAQSECPVTPILNCSISRSLVPSAVQNDFMTSRVNWVVQSSAVDYLHLMLTSMRWLFKKFGIEGRFSLSLHDEIRYLVKSEDRYKAALALQITNLLTRAMCSHQLGMYDLPQSVAFFSSVDVDKVLRKEVTQDCRTPSNPEGLSKGYNIPKGESLDIYELVEITKDAQIIN